MDSSVEVMTSCHSFKKYIETFEKKNEGVKRKKMHSKRVKRNEKIEIFDCEATLMQ